MKVTVIIPNYNHARYLSQRIESVLGQTLQDFEIILLDDCSTDNSRAVIAQYESRDARIRVVCNEKNSGSTFKQWNKGIELATGDYVWLAESDDYAHPEFLHTLAARLDDDPKIGLAYCDSFSVDENGVLMPEPTWTPYLAALDNDLWKHDFTTEGIALVRRFMSYHNIIPNASAVLLRRSTLTAVGPADEDFKVFGDWLFWAKILAVSKVAFTVKPLNYFRTHRNNVRSRTLEDGTALVERTRVLATMQQYGQPDSGFYRKSVQLVLSLWFHAFIYYSVPLARHRKIYQNMVVLEAGFKKQLIVALRGFLFNNKLAGMRMLLGDKLLLPLRKN